MDKLFLEEPQTLYAGFDPTADSLHFGNLLVLMTLLRFVREGHRVICLIGDATASLGDPSGRLSERPQISQEVIDKNVEGVSSDINKLFANHLKYFWKPHFNSPLDDPMWVNCHECLSPFDERHALTFLTVLSWLGNLCLTLQDSIVWECVVCVTPVLSLWMKLSFPSFSQVSPFYLLRCCADDDSRRMRCEAGRTEQSSLWSSSLSSATRISFYFSLPSWCHFLSSSMCINLTVHV